MSQKKDAYFGLDIGTSSVGWAVTDTEYNVISKNGKYLFGARLFREAKTQEGRRVARTARRRIKRRKWRIGLLQDFFREEVCKVDPEFFRRLKESKYVLEDKDFIHTLFNDSTFKDNDYFEQYPTIYHLRDALIKEDRKFDIRLVYLALHHMLKYRGHFLLKDFSASGADSDSGVDTSILEALNSVNDILQNRYPDDDTKISFNSDVVRSLKDSVSNLSGKKDLSNEYRRLFTCSNKELYHLLDLLAGKSAKINKIFTECETDFNESITLDMEDFRESILPKISDSFDEDVAAILDNLKLVYDFLKMHKLLGGFTSLSSAMIARYEQHKEQLAALRTYVKKYHKSKYASIFREYDLSKEIDNYSRYVGYCNSGSKIRGAKSNGTEGFYKFLVEKLSLPKTSNECEKSIDACSVDEQKSRLLIERDILIAMENNAFLLKQNSVDNALFPYQLNKSEMKAILKNQSKYYKFLSLSDRYGTVAEKIVSVLEFKIPYYVGPLIQRKSYSEFGWIVRRTNELIYPWNFDRVVDLDETARIFIEKMTNKCTYLPSEPVLPKHSLLYSEYALLNEINKLRVNGSSISLDDRDDLIKTVFMQIAKPTRTTIKNFFKGRYGTGTVVTNSKGEEIEELKVNLASFVAFSSIFGDQFKKKKDDIEKIIFDLAIFEDRDRLLERLTNLYKLDSAQIKAIMSLDFKGWGRLSKVLLEEINGAEFNTGQHLSIIDSMRGSNENFMEIVESRGSLFRKAIDEFNSVNGENSSKDTYNDIFEGSYLSPSVRRSVWQSICIYRELRKILDNDRAKNQYSISRIFIECTRNESEKKRTDSRGTRIASMLKTANEIIKSSRIPAADVNIANLLSIFDKNADKASVKKVYLYFEQLGKCAYSGESINFEELLNDPFAYDIDHIIPRSIKKDDSFSNIVLCRSELNKDKKDTYPIPDAILSSKARTHWQLLLKLGTVKSEKVENILRRHPLSDEERFSFINRQLVTTNQAVKDVVRILRIIAPEVEIVLARANNISEARKSKYIRAPKCRELNNVHHAHDAYLNIVIGNLYRTLYWNPISWYANSETFEMKSMSEKFTFGVTHSDDKGVVFWDAEKTPSMIRDTLSNKKVLISRLPAFKSGDGGQLSKQTISPAGASDKLIPLKTSDSKLMCTEKYGGYTSATVPYFSLIEHGGSESKSPKYRIVSVPLNVLLRKGFNEQQKTAYISSVLGFSNPKIICDKLPINFVIEVNNARYIVTGNNDDSTLCGVQTAEIYYPYFITSFMSSVNSVLEKYKKNRLITKENIGRTVVSHIINDYPGENIDYVNRLITMTRKFVASVLDTLTEESSLYSSLTSMITSDTMQPIESITVLCKAALIFLCNRILTNSKLQSTREYTRIANSIIEKLSVLDSVDTIQQFVYLREVMKALKTTSESGDLVAFGLSKRAGRVTISKNMTESTKIIAVSVTGFYEKTIWEHPGKKDVI